MAAKKNSSRDKVLLNNQVSPVLVTVKNLASWLSIAAALITGASYFFIHMAEIEATANNQKILYNKVDVVQKDVNSLKEDMGYIKGQLDEMAQKDRRHK